MTSQSPLLLILVLLVALAVPARCFSLFSRKKEPAPPSLVTTLGDSATEASRSFFRGIPEHQRAQYDRELFECDQSSVVLPKARVNDNFCDCADGSDEPGTSACSNGKFTCENKGFRPLQLTSSRVDDGVCDCCDGSDEDGRLVQCENTCDAQAAASRKALEASTNAYKKGSKVRKDLINDITAKVKDGRATVSALDANIERVKGEIDRLRVILEEELVSERTEQADIKRKMLQEYANFLELESFGEKDLASLIVNLFSVFDVIDEDVPDLIAALQKDDVEAMRPAAQVKVGAEGDMDTYGDYDDYDDIDVNDRPSIPEYKDVEPVSDSNVVYTASNCDLLKYELDDRLAPFCTVTTRDLRRFVVNYLISRKATKEAQLIMGFFKAKNTFVDSAEFVLEYNGVNNQPPNPCPAEISEISGACAVDEGLRKIMETHNYADHKKKGAEDVRSAIRNLSNKQSDTERQRKEHDDLVNAAKDYEGYFDLLAIRNQCFDTRDAQYTYTVCIGKDVRQKDTGGGASTLLGNFDAPNRGGLTRISNPKQKVGNTGLEATLRMKFERGQHCHAFGARSAEVLMECGAENKLVEASEPSTCFYSFRMESPVACNEDFAHSLGIPV